MEKTALLALKLVEITFEKQVVFTQFLRHHNSSVMVSSLDQLLLLGIGTQSSNSDYILQIARYCWCAAYGRSVVVCLILNGTAPIVRFALPCAVTVKSVPQWNLSPLQLMYPSANAYEVDSASNTLYFMGKNKKSREIVVREKEKRQIFDECHHSQLLCFIEYIVLLYYDCTSFQYIQVITHCINVYCVKIIYMWTLLVRNFLQHMHRGDII